MKKLGLVIALVAVGLLTSKSYADVQNIRLSGDIRIRGYFLSHADSNNREDQNFISQRTRVTCEADLEDHVLVVVTLKAESQWGRNDEIDNSAGAGLPPGQTINRAFDVGINEVYVQLSEVFYTPATLKIGRQYLNYGRGLILSSCEQEYNFDAARLVLDYYPLTIDLVYARAIERTTFGAADGTPGPNAHLLFANARYEMTDSLVKDIEAYVGWMATDENTFAGRVPPTVNGASPVIIGLRTDLNLTKGLQTWAEVAYECGTDGPGGAGISAALVNVGGNYTVPNCQWAPVFNLGYTYATGGGENGKHNFRPWFDYQDGYNGYLAHPVLSNIHIFNLGAAVRPAKNLTLSEQVYYYLRSDDSLPTAIANQNVDFGAIGATQADGRKEIGWEFDTILGYDYSKDVRCQLVYGVLIPDAALRDSTSASGGFSSVAHEVRGELIVKF